MTAPSDKKINYLITDKARTALAEARRRARENSVPRATVEVFVTRITGGKLYGWEIRQFGGVVLERAQGAFTTPAEAQTDGARALAGRFPTTSDEHTP